MFNQGLMAKSKSIGKNLSSFGQESLLAFRAHEKDSAIKYGPYVTHVIGGVQRKPVRMYWAVLFQSTVHARLAHSKQAVCNCDDFFSAFTESGNTNGQI